MPNGAAGRRRGRGGGARPTSCCKSECHQRTQAPNDG
uniref:Uncharacterized protein n=1 Tax=Arundo donax TaxID=35708 RepID=A0A0A9BYR8_ARUDO